jgi:hypothetical protein
MLDPELSGLLICYDQATILEKRKQPATLRDCQASFVCRALASPKTRRLPLGQIVDRTAERRD